MKRFSGVEEAVSRVSGGPLLWSEKSLFVLAVRKNYISVFVFRNTDTQAVGKDIFENCAGL